MTRSASIRSFALAGLLGACGGADADGSDTDESTTATTTDTSSTSTSSESGDESSEEETDTGTDLPCVDIETIPVERTEWRQEYDLGATSHFVADLAFLESGDAVVIGTARHDTGDDIFVAAHASDGEELWSWTRDFEADDTLRFVQPAVAGGFVVAGEVRARKVPWVAEYDADGSMIWEAELEEPAGGPDYADDAVRGLAVQSNGDVAVLGITVWDLGEGENATVDWLAVIRNSGSETEIVWSSEDEPFLSNLVVNTSDELFFSHRDGAEAAIRKLSSNGSLQWKTIIDSGEINEAPRLVGLDGGGVAWAGGAWSELPDAYGTWGVVTPAGDPSWSAAADYCGGLDGFVDVHQAPDGQLIALRIYQGDLGDPLTITGAIESLGEDDTIEWSERLPAVDDGRPMALAISPDGFAFVTGTAGAKDEYTYYISRIGL